MDVTFVKAGAPADRDRVYLEVEGGSRRLPVHAVHDLPHLVVESLFGIDDGLWGELVDGRHASAERAATARDSTVSKHGRIVSGGTEAVPISRWLTDGHRRAKAVTNAVANRFGDGSDTPAGVQDRVARSGDESAQRLLAGVDDFTVEAAIKGIHELLRRWASLPPGGVLRLTWPLEVTASSAGDESP